MSERSKKAAPKARPVPAKSAGPKAGASKRSSGPKDPQAAKHAAINQLAAKMPFNQHKPAEHGDASRKTPEGEHFAPSDAVKVKRSDRVRLVSMKSESTRNDPPAASASAPAAAADKQP